MTNRYTTVFWQLILLCVCFGVGHSTAQPLITLTVVATLTNARGLGISGVSSACESSSTREEPVTTSLVRKQPSTTQ